MKLSHALLVLVASATVVFARFVAIYDDSKPPTMSLPAGYDLAIKALGSSTNQFHCISATVAGSGFTDDIVEPAWLFSFCSTNTPPRYKDVTVGFDGKTHVEERQKGARPE